MCHMMQLMKTMKQALVKQIAEAVKLCNNAAPGAPLGGRRSQQAKQPAKDRAKTGCADLNGMGQAGRSRVLFLCVPPRASNERCEE